MRGRIEATLEMARKTNNYGKFRKEFYDTSLGDIISDSRETVPCMLALFYLAEGDPNMCVVYGANFGRDADTIGTMAGALAGAFRSASAIKPEWVAKIESAFDKKQAISKDYGMPEIDAPNQISLARSLAKVVEQRLVAQKSIMAAVEDLRSR
jgi:ADP-ribosylglycohydrolase